MIVAEDDDNSDTAVDIVRSEVFAYVCVAPEDELDTAVVEMAGDLKFFARGLVGYGGVVEWQYYCLCLSAALFRQVVTMITGLPANCLMVTTDEFPHIHANSEEQFDLRCTCPEPNLQFLHGA